MEKIRTHDFYNASTKEEYLNTLESEGTQGLFETLFEKSKTTEEFFDKDLLFFNLNEIGKVVKNTNPTTQTSVVNTVSRIRRYITWAIQNGRRNNIHPLDGITLEWEKQFIDDTVKRHFSDKEMAEIVDNLLNAQDQALIQCIYEGILGKGMSELTSLNYNNIDWDNNTILLRDSSNNEREITVSDKCLRLIENAYSQTVYVNELSLNEYDLHDFHKNIFKINLHKGTKMMEITRAMLAKRISIIKEKYELEQFSSKTISESGQIKMAHDLLEEDGKITSDSLETIGEKYNTSRINSDHYTNKINTTMLRMYITKDIISSLYNSEK